MGGHGGLNILPQKRWNVYNRDNRLKVSQDEAKAAALEAEERARAEQAEREFRYARLARKAQGEPEPPPALPVAAPQAETQLAVAQPLEHVNFWKEDELKMKAQHPEVEAEKKAEARKRGNPDMYTSDPRFDERFQLGYNMKGDEPWWTKKKTSVGSSQPDTQPLAALTPHVPAQPPATAQLLPPPPSGSTAQQQQQQLSLQGPGTGGPSRDGKRSRRGDEQVSETGGNDQVAAAKQFLRQVLGDQVDALISSSESDSSSSSSGSGSDTSSSGSSSDSSDGSSSSDGGRGRRGGQSRKGRHRKQSRHSSKRESDSKSSRRKRRRDDSDSEGDRGRGGSRKRHKSRSKGRDKSKVSSRERKSSRKHKSRGHSKERGRVGKAVSTLPGVKSIEQLRAERMERELAERKRERLVLVGALGGPDTLETQGYNSGFGHAAALKKSRG